MAINYLTNQLIVTPDESFARAELINLTVKKKPMIEDNLVENIELRLIEF